MTETARRHSLTRRASTLLPLLLTCAACLPAHGWAAKPAKTSKPASAVPKDKLSPVFYPGPPDSVRFQFLGTVTSSEPFQKEKKGAAAIVLGDKAQRVERKVERAYGVAMKAGRLYICDSGGGTGLIFDAAKREVAAFNVDNPKLALTAPINIAMTADGRKFVSDTQHQKILVLGADDRPAAVIEPGRVTALTSAWQSRESSDACVIPAMKPGGVAVWGNELFVSDVATATVQVLDATTGCRLREFGSRGGADGQFMAPANLTIDAQGYVYVSDMVTAKVQKFDRKGGLVRTFGSMGRHPGQFIRPRGMAVDPEGRLYVVDGATQVVQLFDSEGRLLMALGQTGDDRGGLNLPAGIAIADDLESVAYASSLAAPGFRLQYLVLVSNQDGPNKINLYGFGSMEGSGAAK